MVSFVSSPSSLACLLLLTVVCCALLVVLPVSTLSVSEVNVGAVCCCGLCGWTYSCVVGAVWAFDVTLLGLIAVLKSGLLPSIGVCLLGDVGLCWVLLLCEVASCCRAFFAFGCCCVVG